MARQSIMGQRWKSKATNFLEHPKLLLGCGSADPRWRSGERGTLARPSFGYHASFFIRAKRSIAGSTINASSPSQHDPAGASANEWERTV
jgi:hypothetical protein